MTRKESRKVQNNDPGILLFCISRNPRTSPPWDTLRWIAANGPGSSGLWFVHDEDVADPSRRGPGIAEGFDKVFRVPRILEGSVAEWTDPFFGPIAPHIDRPHPYDRDDDARGESGMRFRQMGVAQDDEPVDTIDPARRCGSGRCGGRAAARPPRAASPRWRFPAQSVRMTTRAVAEGEAGRPHGGVRAAKDSRGA
jgi:hypothetical protein